MWTLQSEVNHAGIHHTSCSHANAPNLHLLCIHPLQHPENQLRGWSKQKPFQHALPNTVVVLFYGTALSAYLKPSATDSEEIDKFISFGVWCINPNVESYHLQSTK